MPESQIEAHVALLIGDAVKGLLDRVGRLRLEQAQSGVGADPRELTTAYGDLRRIRERIRRIAVGRGKVLLDLTSHEGDLAACALLWEIMDLSAQLQADDPRNRRESLRFNLQACMHWAGEFASRPVLHLIPGLHSEDLQRCPEVIKVCTQIRQKVNPTEAGRSLLQLNDTRRTTQSTHVPTATDPSQSPQSGTAPLDPADLLQLASCVASSRLRPLVTVEQRALQRAVAAADFRTATLHLSAIYEAIVVDQGLSRRDEIGVSQDPERWDLRDVIARLLGRPLRDTEASIAAYLESVHDMMRPAVQLSRPVVANRRSFERCVGFLEDLLVSLRVLPDTMSFFWAPQS